MPAGISLWHTSFQAKKLCENGNETRVMPQNIWMRKSKHVVLYDGSCCFLVQRAKGKGNHPSGQMKSLKFDISNDQVKTEV